MQERRDGFGMSSINNVPPLPEAGGEEEEDRTGKEFIKKQRTFMTKEMRHKILGRSDGAETFNLDQYQLKKLNMILERVAVRKKHEKQYDPSLSRAQIRMLELEELVVEENKSYRARRAENSSAALGVKLAILGEELELRKLIHRQGVRAINNRDIFNGRNPLHEAVASGHLHIVKMFLDEYRCNANVTTMLGTTTSLHIACERGFRQIASILITFGANVMAKDFRGATPLHVCSNKACVKLILRYWDYIDPLAKTSEGLLPSAHYWKYTDDDDKVAEIQQILMKAEEKKAAENARMNRIRQRLMYEDSQALLDKTYKVDPKKNRMAVAKMGLMIEKKKPKKGEDSDSD